MGVDETRVSKLMVKFAGSISLESIVLAEAVVTSSPEPILAATVQSLELHVRKLYVLSSAEPNLPIQIEDAQRPETEEDVEGRVTVGLDSKLNARVLDLRTRANQAIFRIQAGVSRLFREYLEERNFVEIHTPKLSSAASEGGANVFKVTYFNGNAFLAQSPQLHKQMMIASDFERVYEIAPVFRAENSFTHRHMTEFIGLDLEMAFEEHYHEAMDLIEQMFVFMFKNLKSRYETEITAVRTQYNVPEFELPPNDIVPRITFKQGLQLLRDNGVEIEDDLADIDTPTEKRLGAIIKAKYHTDFYTMDKFPLGIRPFYTMPDANDPVSLKAKLFNC